MAGGQQQQSIDLSVLSLEQLNQMKTQHEEEVQSLSGNFMKLRDAQVRLLLLFVSTFFPYPCTTHTDTHTHQKSSFKDGHGP